jgi:cytoplasmic iron level regulating protein YaaA (DUF328/UPF0246 family)
VLDPQGAPDAVRQVRAIKAPVILLPPSEGKAPGGVAKPWTGVLPELDADRMAVRDEVRRVIAGGEAAASRLLGVKGRHLAQASEDWEALDDAPTLPASRRYSGVVWSALDPATLDAVTHRRLNARVMVPSGLWGVVAAGDPIPAYRLKMSARLPAIGSLGAFWRPRITPIIDRRAAGGWVIDLLPNEHAAAIDVDALRRSRLVRVELLEAGDGRRSVGHAGKTLKGLVARAILEADARRPEDIAGLRVLGVRAEGVTATPNGALVVFRRSGEKA